MDLIRRAEEAMTHEAYREALDAQVKQGIGTGLPDGGYSPDHTKLNLARTRRLEKTLVVLPEVHEVMAGAAKQTWLVLTEPWCGDSAQNLPVIVALAEQAPSIVVKVLLRDVNLDVMDAYLTNGARAIPKLIAFDPSSGRELFTWGPRPAIAQALIMDEKRLPEEQRSSKAVLAEKLHAWYATNGGRDTQLELMQLVRSSGH